jgi:2-oxoglutarate ferredoxin oxidoreductase subunit beta
VSDIQSFCDARISAGSVLRRKNAGGHDTSNLQQAKALATQVQDRIACGILYQREDIPHFYNRLIPRQGLDTTCVEEVRKYDVSEYWKELV